jgi:ABC-type glutathione transport system ATPase component
MYIGFIGGTGAGKTTVINAILREVLLPTDSLKACTSVVSQVAYNKSNEPNKLYRAEVEFVTRDDWEKELAVLFQDVDSHFRDSEMVGLEQDVSYQDSDRVKRITDTLATLKVVYPHLKSIDDMRHTSVPKLLEDKNVRRILGSTTEIYKAKPKSFARAIRPYIATSDEDDVDFWPLIKCVKVFVKSLILKSGIVLVE